MYSTFTARNRDLAQKLSRKLQLETSIPEHKRQSQQWILDDKYKQVSDKLKILKTKNQRNQQEIAHDLQVVEDGLFTIEHARNKSYQMPAKLSENLEKFILFEQTTNSDKMAAVRKGMIEDIDKKKKAMKTDAIEVIEQEFEQLCKANLSDVEKKTNILLNMLEQQKSSKQESASFLAHTIGQEILKMQQMITQERQARKAQNKSILDLIQDVEDKFDSQIKEEVKLRIKSEQFVQSRLEELCFKIQQKILGN